MTDTFLFPEFAPPAPPPISDWANYGHEVNGANPRTATYRRAVDGVWQRWDYAEQAWRDEWPQPSEGGPR